MKAMKKALALMLCALLVFSLLISVSFVSHGALHECGGEDCQICAVIHRCAEMLKELLAVASFAAFSGAVLFATLCAPSEEGIFFASVTPVRLKDKLSN